MEITIRTPADFSFKRTVLSHGWCQLLPFEFDQDRWELWRVIEWPEQGGHPCTIRIRGTKRDGACQHGRATLNGEATAKIERDVRHMLRLDDDMKGFYGAVVDDPEFSWIAREGAGRLLRSPTVFEDLVKSLCTTNCSWALTEKMVTALVIIWGARPEMVERLFPRRKRWPISRKLFIAKSCAQVIARPYLKELAERVAAKELNPESWLVSELPTPELKREMKRVKGVGDYAAENLLKLVGRYDCLALDSWVRAKFARTRGRAGAGAPRLTMRRSRASTRASTPGAALRSGAT